MIAERCYIHRYTPAWALGTGLRVTLRPGVYLVTGKERTDGRLYFHLSGRYRVDARELFNTVVKDRQ